MVAPQGVAVAREVKLEEVELVIKVADKEVEGIQDRVTDETTQGGPVYEGSIEIEIESTEVHQAPPYAYIGRGPCLSSYVPYVLQTNYAKMDGRPFWRNFVICYYL